MVNLSVEYWLICIIRLIVTAWFWCCANFDIRKWWFICRGYCVLTIHTHWNLPILKNILFGIHRNICAIRCFQILSKTCICQKSPQNKRHQYCRLQVALLYQSGCSARVLTTCFAHTKIVSIGNIMVQGQLSLTSIPTAFYMYVSICLSLIQERTTLSFGCRECGITGYNICQEVGEKNIYYRRFRFSETFCFQLYATDI